jgi:hypothetical protein
MIDRTAVALLGLLAVFIMAALFVASDAEMGMQALDAERMRRALSYRSQALTALRLGVGLTGIFLGMHGFSRDARRAALFFADGGRGILPFATARILSGLLLIGIFGTALFLFYAVLGVMGTPYLVLCGTDAQMWGDILGEGMLFFLLQGILTLLADSVFSAVPTFVLLWMLEVETEEGGTLELVLHAVVRHGSFQSGSYRVEGSPFAHLSVFVFAFIFLLTIFGRKDVA